jgi:hypothetical protein
MTVSATCSTLRRRCCRPQPDQRCLSGAGGGGANLVWEIQVQAGANLVWEIQVQGEEEPT